MDRFRRRTKGLDERKIERVDDTRTRDKKRCIVPFWQTERGQQRLKEWAEQVARWNERSVVAVNQAQENPMLTVRQAASILSMTPANICARLNRGTIRGEKISSPNAAGFYWMIQESEVKRVKEGRK